MMTIFSKIIKGEIPSYKIAENDQFFAFLDINPMMPGHTLIVPKVEIDRFFDVPDVFLQNWLAFAKPIARAIEAVVPCDRVGITVMGLEVPHAHMHLVPINSADDVNFTRPKLKMEPAAFIAVQEKIVEALNSQV
ncbi:HIT family protein [Chitinophaga caeni]|uniref:HIT family protein n=2 Tax=Chitinophaga caeni TaxID=2029983 RepID=A0A291R0G8_9BACT|nr:HIT family protein [Chitinophaga caeni]